MHKSCDDCKSQGIGRCRACHLEAVSSDDAHVSRYPVTKLHLDDVTDDQLLRVDVQLLTITQHNRILHSTDTICVSSTTLSLKNHDKFKKLKRAGDANEDLAYIFQAAD